MPTATVATDDIQLLRKALQRFYPLGEEAFANIIPYLHYNDLEKRQRFVAKGRISQSAALVLDGHLRQYYRTRNSEYTTYFYFEHMLVADYAGAITRQPATLTIEALSKVRLLSFPMDTVRRFYRQSHEWAQVGLAMAEYIALGLEERMVDLITLSAEERYIKLLGSNKERILERIPQQYIANYLGITPVSFSRLRAKLSR